MPVRTWKGWGAKSRSGCRGFNPREKTRGALPQKCGLTQTPRGAGLWWCGMDVGQDHEAESNSQTDAARILWPGAEAKREHLPVGHPRYCGLHVRHILPECDAGGRCSPAQGAGLPEYFGPDASLYPEGLADGAL